MVAGRVDTPITTISSIPTAIAAKGNRLYITHSNGTVTVVQINSDTSSSLLGFIILPVGVTPAGIAIRPASGSIISDRLYITANTTGTNDFVYVIAITPAL